MLYAVLLQKSLSAMDELLLWLFSSSADRFSILIHFSEPESVMSNIFGAQRSTSIWVWSMNQEEREADSLHQGIPDDSFVFVPSNRLHQIKSAICSQAEA